MLVSNCAICGKNKTSFINNKEASELLSKLEVRIPLSNIQLVIFHFKTVVLK